MAGNHLKQLAEQQGYPMMGRVARCTRFDEPVGFAYTDQGSVYVITAPIKEESWSKEIQKELKKELKPYGGLSYHNATHYVQLTFSAMTREKAKRKLEEGADALVAALREKNVEFSDACVYCGQGGSEDFCDREAACMPAHTSCKSQAAQEILAKIEENEANGSIALGLVGALIGSLVGAIPTVLVAYFMESMVMVLYLLIPLASYQGYKMTKGKMVSFVPFLIALFSIASTVLAELVFTHLVLREIRSVTFLDTVDMAFNSSISMDFFRNLGISLLFCVGGIALTWSQISKSNKHLRKQAEEIAKPVSSSKIEQ